MNDFYDAMADLGEALALRDEDEHDQALRRIAELFGTCPLAGTTEAAELRLLIALVTAYERPRRKPRPGDYVTEGEA